MTLGQLIRAQKGRLTFEDLAERSGQRISRANWHVLASSGTGMKNFPDPPTLAAISDALGVSLASVILAAARSTGLTVPEPGSQFATRLPADVDELDDDDAQAVLQVLRSLPKNGPTPPSRDRLREARPDGDAS